MSSSDYSRRTNARQTVWTPPSTVLIPVDLGCLRKVSVCRSSGRQFSARLARPSLREQEPSILQSGVAQGDRQSVTEVFDWVHLDFPTDLPGRVLQLALVLLRDHDRRTPRSARPQYLLLQPADWQNASGDRDLASHSHVVSDRAFGQRGDEGGGHRDTGRRPVLR